MGGTSRYPRTNGAAAGRHRQAKNRVSALGSARIRKVGDRLIGAVEGGLVEGPLALLDESQGHNSLHEQWCTVLAHQEGKALVADGEEDHVVQAHHALEIAQPVARPVEVTR